MPGPFEAAGTAHEPTEYAPLTMDRYITGLWTQRSPLRDANVPYVYGKFYGASRFDSLIDGLNREITSKLTSKRRPGLSVYNSGTFNAVRSFYSYKFIQDGKQVVRVLADTATYLFDITPPGSTIITSKSFNAGPWRFCSVGTQLFMANGTDSKKWTQSAKSWKANTAYNGGDFIIDPSGNIQLVQSNVAATATLSSYQILQVTTSPPRFVLAITWTTNAPQWTPQMRVTFSGTSLTQLNGQVLVYDPTIVTQYALPTSPNVTYFTWPGPVTASTPSGGTASGHASNGGTSGSVPPPAGWTMTPGGITHDGTITWTCMGPALQNWSLAGPTTAPVFTTYATMRYWQPYFTVAPYFAVIDANGNIEMVSGTSNYAQTGQVEPTWNEKFEGQTQDGNLVYWTNCGNLGSWAPYTYTYLDTAILDPNGYLQVAISAAPVGAPPTVASTTGATPPSFKTGLGMVTTGDGDISWVNAGPGVVLSTGPFTYAYSWHCVDGSITTASPAVVIPNGILGETGNFQVTLTGATPPDPQCDSIYIWRTDQGGATMVFRASIPNPSPGTAGTWTWTDTDPTSAALNPLISAPLNAVGANNPPSSTATAPEYHLQRIWMIDGSKVIWSGGPDTIPGNGNTSFPGNNVIQFPETLTRLMSSITNDAVLLVFGTANVYAILGDGTSTFVPVVYMPTVGFLNYDAITRVGGTIYGFSNNRKAVELDPGAGYVEYGFPIGDQFTQMSSGGQTAALFDPTKTYVTWYEKQSADSALYVCDGSVGWFRYSPVAAPEQGFLWSPFAAITGGTSAVQSVEIATGQFALLVGPVQGSAGPILMRDTSTSADNGTVFPSYMTLGNIVLCESGEVAEVAHVALDALRIGDRPTVGMLYGEIAETTNIGFDMLEWTSDDPPTLEESETLYSDRYVTSQDGVTPKCRHVQIKVEWPEQNIPDELLSHAIYGAKYSERRLQPG